jgi:hypothetical protein
MNPPELDRRGLEADDDGFTAVEVDNSGLDEVRGGLDAV